MFGSAGTRFIVTSVEMKADEDKDAVKALSDDGLSYEGTVVRGGVRRDSE